MERENENISRTVEAQRDRDLQQSRLIEELRGQLRAKEQDIDRLLGKSDVIGYHSRQAE